MPDFEILQYQTVDGRAPFAEWHNSIKDFQAWARIQTQIVRLAFGLFGDFKSLAHGVVELRLHFGPGYRVYFGRHGMRIIILLCGGDKSTQREDILMAYKYWTDYKRRIDEAL